jgi:hypothetical protein
MEERKAMEVPCFITHSCMVPKQYEWIKYILEMPQDNYKGGIDLVVKTPYPEILTNSIDIHGHTFTI